MSKSESSTTNTGRKMELSRNKGIGISIIVTLLVAFGSVLGKLSTFETIVFSVITIIGCPVMFTWFKLDNFMTTFGETAKTHFANLSVSFNKIQKYKNTKSAFIIDLYKEEINTINTSLDLISSGDWFPFDTNIFRRFPTAIFKKTKDKSVDYLYATVYCGDKSNWFTSREGGSYLEQISNNVKTQESVRNAQNAVDELKYKIKRIFIYQDDIQNIPNIDWIHIQLHINSGYQVKIMNAKKYADIYPHQGEQTFAVYRKSFVWKKFTNDPKMGEMSVGSDKIKGLTETFKNLWIHVDCIYPTVPPNIKDHCNNRLITSLYNVIDEAKRKGLL